MPPTEFSKLLESSSVSLTTTGRRAKRRGGVAAIRSREGSNVRSAPVGSFASKTTSGRVCRTVYMAIQKPSVSIQTRGIQ
jgi:hypothetical protein